MPKIEKKKHAENIPEAEERRILYKVVEIICFSANVCQCNFACSVVHVQLCL